MEHLKFCISVYAQFVLIVIFIITSTIQELVDIFQLNLLSMFWASHGVQILSNIHNLWTKENRNIIAHVKHGEFKALFS